MLTKSQVIDLLTVYCNEHIPFNRLLGLEVIQVAKEQVQLSIKMKPELVGNTFHNTLHGGVTASVLDVAGGLIAMVNKVERFEDLEPQLLQDKLKNIGTVDLRIDYLLPGRGEKFTAVARVIRHGRKVAVMRMELHNEKNEVIALGTATYLVG